MTTIQLKRSTTAGHVPTLLAGELAQNLPDGLLYYRNPSAVVTPFKLTEASRLITSGSVTNAASLTLSIDPAVIGVMRAFRMHIMDWRPATSGSQLQMQLGDSASIYTAANYQGGLVFSSGGNGGFISTDLNSNDTIIWLTEINDSSSSRGGMCGTIWFSGNDPAASDHNYVISNIGTEYNISGWWPVENVAYGSYSTALDLTRFLLKFSSGNIAVGKYMLLGVP